MPRAACPWKTCSGRGQQGDVLQVASKYNGASVSDVTRLRELEAENVKLKCMFADLALENAAIRTF
jgi:hypothetical protein